MPRGTYGDLRGGGCFLRARCPCVHLARTLTLTLAPHCLFPKCVAHIVVSERLRHTCHLPVSRGPYRDGWDDGWELSTHTIFYQNATRRGEVGRGSDRSNLHPHRQHPALLVSHAPSRTRAIAPMHLARTLTERMLYVRKCHQHISPPSCSFRSRPYPTLDAPRTRIRIVHTRHSQIRPPDREALMHLLNESDIQHATNHSLSNTLSDTHWHTWPSRTSTGHSMLPSFLCSSGATQVPRRGDTSFHAQVCCSRF